MFTSRQIKHSRLLLRHARKYLRYKHDRLSDVDREQIVSEMQTLREALRSKDRQNIHTAAETLDKTLHKLTPVTWESHWRENCEVILVAIVIAVGIRSYFVQPFKIPTGSMQPTLNGIIAHPSNEPAPNILRQIVEFVLLGRNYINVVSQQDNQISKVEPRRVLFFFTWSRIICDRPVTTSRSNLLTRIRDVILNGCYFTDNEINVYCPPDQLSGDFSVFPGRHVHPDEVIARGAINTGDQVFVDKCSYNFVKPSHGDVFVFRTNDIMGIPADPVAGPPFYIKRLAGLPGDQLRIDSPYLFINGSVPQAFGFQRVMGMKDGYRGYGAKGLLSDPTKTFTVPSNAYFALGDNSYNSSDSRYWGPLPEQNVVGRGLFVYWPFLPHWGLIR
jgi:signal peptidase I